MLCRRIRKTSFGVVFALLALSGCGGDVPSEHAAHVGGWTLTPDRLAESIVLAQPFALDSAAATELAVMWAEASAYAQARDEGVALEAPEVVEAAMWLERREALLALERDARLGESISIAAEEAEAAFYDGDFRLVAHVLRRVGPETSASERELQRRAADRILSDLVGGGAWNAAVAESEDPETRDASGLIGLVGRGELPPTLERAVFQMEPGQVSSVTASPAGFHVLYRPRYEEVVDLFRGRLLERRVAEADARSAPDVLAARGVEVARGAIDRLRTWASAPLDAEGDGSAMAEWDGGQLDDLAVLRYLRALPSQDREAMVGAAEADLVGFVESLALREIRLADAVVAGLELDQDVLSSLTAQHEEELAFWDQALGLPSGDARAGVRRYIEGVVARRVEARSITPLLASWLMSRAPWDVSAEGVLVGLDRAKAMLDAVDQESGDQP